MNNIHENLYPKMRLFSENAHPSGTIPVTLNKKHGNAMKPGFQATIALYLLLKLLALGSWCDECITIYFKTSSFSKLAKILQSN